MSNSNSVSLPGLTGQSSIPEASRPKHNRLWNTGCPAQGGAITVEEMRLNVLAARNARVLPIVTLRNSEGAGSAGCTSRTRGYACKKKTPQVHRKHRHSLRNGLRLVRVLLGVPGLLASVALALGVSDRRPAPPSPGLDPSVGGSGPRDFAVRQNAFVHAREARRAP
jgi:hypothetical protein